MCSAAQQDEVEDARLGGVWVEVPEPMPKGVSPVSPATKATHP